MLTMKFSLIRAIGNTLENFLGEKRFSEKAWGLVQLFHVKQRNTQRN